MGVDTREFAVGTKATPRVLEPLDFFDAPLDHAGRRVADGEMRITPHRAPAPLAPHAVGARRQHFDPVHAGGVGDVSARVCNPAGVYVRQP